MHYPDNAVLACIISMQGNTNTNAYAYANSHPYCSHHAYANSHPYSHHAYPCATTRR